MMTVTILRLFHLLQIKISFTDTKEFNLLLVVEYAVTMVVDHKPSLIWWVQHILKKSNATIVLVESQSSRHLKHLHKFGIIHPNTV